MPCLVNYATTTALSATQVNLCLVATANGVITVDGSQPALNEIILVKNQADQTQNGVYDVIDTGSVSTPFKLKRNEKALYLQSGGLVYVKFGTLNSETNWVLCVSELFTIEVDPLVFTQAGGNNDQVFLSLNEPTSQTVPPSTPIMWSVVVEDNTGMYNPGTGVVTIPQSGIWQIHCRVLISQDVMANFPASFYQHLMILTKNTPFPDGFTIRFIDTYQDDFTSNAPPVTVSKQATLQGTETVRLTSGDELSIQLSTVTFAPVGGTVSTVISGTICLNCCTFTRIGD